MKLILCQDVPNVGKVGETVKVADGYARNYLLPRKLAVGLGSGGAKQIEHELRIIHAREEKRRTELTKAAKAIEAVSIEFKVRAGAEDKIFGSVTAADIAEKLTELGHAVDRKMIHLDEPIKALGIFSVPVRVASGIEANVKVWVNPIEEPAAESHEETTETT